MASIFYKLIAITKLNLCSIVLNCAYIFCIIYFVSTSCGIAADKSGEILFQFEIPALPVEKALDEFSKITGAQILYEPSITRNLRAPALSGRYPSDEALRILLGQSGLAAQPTAADAYTIVALPKPLPPPSHPRPEDENTKTGQAKFLVKYSYFLGKVQKKIIDALCSKTISRPGDYFMEMRLWFSPSGQISNTVLERSTGDNHRDAVILRLVQKLDIGVSTPQDLPQPFTMSIVPRKSERADECRNSGDD